MAYSENAKKASIKYMNEKQKRIYLRIKKDDFENIVEPAIKKSGLSTATYIKKAIYEKIERENNAE